MLHEQLNLSTITLGLSLNGSSNHRNLRASRSSSATEIIRKAFSKSSTSAVTWHLNLTTTSAMVSESGGPEYNNHSMTGLRSFSLKHPNQFSL